MRAGADAENGSVQGGVDFAQAQGVRWRRARRRGLRHTSGSATARDGGWEGEAWWGGIVSCHCVPLRAVGSTARALLITGPATVRAGRQWIPLPSTIHHIHDAGRHAGIQHGRNRCPAHDLDRDGGHERRADDGEVRQ